MSTSVAHDRLDNEEIQEKDAPSERDTSIDAHSRQDVEALSASNEEKVEASAPPGQTDDTEYPSTKALILILACLYSSTFLFALDRTIIATAIPQITDEFGSFGDVGWYGSAYLLTFCAFQLFFGRIFTFYSVKWVFITLIVVFEVGSAVCGAAPNSNAFIVGRAIAGLGSSGMLGGSVVIIIQSVPLHKRPMLMGLFGAVFGVASVAGPLLGGVFTTDVTWRWCFYINLPIGGFVVFALALILKNDKPSQAGTPIREQITRLDPLGTLVFLPGIVCLLLALQWGGTTFPWGNGRIIALFVLAGVLLTAFMGIQFWKGDNATLPPRIMKQRSVAFGFLYILAIASAMLVSVYYIPIYFQAIKGTSAVESGIRNLPLLIALVIASILSGIFTQKVGYYVPQMILGAILTPIGAGLISTWDLNTGPAAWIGYQVILGLGIGCSMQQPSVAAQTVLEKKDVPTGTALMFFGQSLGGSIFIAIAQLVLSNRLISLLSGVPGFDPQRVAATGATELRRLVGPERIHTVLLAYSEALKGCFYVTTAVASLCIVGALGMEWKSVKANKK